MKKRKDIPTKAPTLKSGKYDHEYDPAARMVHQPAEDGRRAPQHQADKYAVPKASASPLLAEHDDLPGLDAIESKYAEELERGRQLSAKFGR